MNIHEFQAKQMFASFGIPVPKGKEVKTAGAAERWAAKLETPVFVVKAQIHAGGRGKAGGVKLTKNRADVPGLAKELLGKTLVTHQTGPKGRKVRDSADRGRRRHCEGTVCESAGGSRFRLADLYRQHRRRHGH